METTYYIGGGNGNAILEDVLNGLGWKRVTDKNDDNVKLRWCETKAAINYKAFREKEHLVNHIPNCQILTNKLGLLNSLQEYAKILTTVHKKSFKLDFIPETYCLDDGKNKEAFENAFKEKDIWICKPTARNQGKGIFLVRAIEDLKDQIEIENFSSKPHNRIIQRYITNPLLLDGRKFDIRCYMLVASMCPYVILYHKGYCRLSMYKYDNNCDNIIAHLTNQFIQKRDPRYNETKEDTAWSMDKFNEYVNENVAANKNIPQDWVLNELPIKMKQIMMHCFNSVKTRLERKIGYFDLYGLDFLVDEDMKVWLIEMNINPCLATNCSALKEIVPGVVKETLNISIECFEKARRGKSLFPLNSIKNFEALFIERLPAVKVVAPRSSSRKKDETQKAQNSKTDALVSDDGDTAVANPKNNTENVDNSSNNVDNNSNNNMKQLQFNTQKKSSTDNHSTDSEIKLVENKNIDYKHNDNKYNDNKYNDDKYNDNKYNDNKYNANKYNDNNYNDKEENNYRKKNKNNKYEETNNAEKLEKIDGDNKNIKIELKINLTKKSSYTKILDNEKSTAIKKLLEADRRNYNLKKINAVETEKNISMVDEKTVSKLHLKRIIVDNNIGNVNLSSEIKKKKVPTATLR